MVLVSIPNQIIDKCSHEGPILHDGSSRILHMVYES
jgi:hypothetical protein